MSVCSAGTDIIVEKFEDFVSVWSPFDVHFDDAEVLVDPCCPIECSPCEVKAVYVYSAWAVSV